MDMEKLEIRGMEVDFKPFSGFKVDIWSNVLNSLLSSLIEKRVGIFVLFEALYDEDNGHLHGFTIDQELDFNEEEKINKTLNVSEFNDVEVDDKLYSRSEYLKYILYEYMFSDGNVQTYSSDSYSSYGDVKFTFLLTEDQFNHFKSFSL